MLNLDMCSPSINITFITSEPNIRLGSFLFLYFFVLLEKPRPRCLHNQLNVCVCVIGQTMLIKQICHIVMMSVQYEYVYIQME